WSSDVCSSDLPTNKDFAYSSASTFQTVEIIDIDGVQITEQHHQNRQTDGSFGCGHGHNKEYEDLSGGIVQIMRKRQEVGIHRQQHHFDRHQQHDQVFTVQKDADHADGKQHGAQYKIMRQRYHLETSKNLLRDSIAALHGARSSPISLICLCRCADQRLGWRSFASLVEWPCNAPCALLSNRSL